MARSSSNLQSALFRWKDLLDSQMESQTHTHETNNNELQMQLEKLPCTAGDSDETKTDLLPEDWADAFCNTLVFGTAGLRQKEGPGFNRMNDITIALSTQGLAQYIIEQGTLEARKDFRVVLGYDGRYGSESFAQVAAAVMLHAGIKVHMYDRPVPTPLVSFGVTAYQCDSGIMITASHNPKEYNGYKVYWNKGSQIIPPHDSNIASHIERQDKLWKIERRLEKYSGYELLDSIKEAKLYCAKAASGVCADISLAKNEPIVYTPLHGVGGSYLNLMFDAFNISHYIPTPEQDLVDPNFSTVSFPNPEEGPAVWQLAFSEAEKRGIGVCIANDPDADRFCVAEKQADKKGTWRIFSGNDIGIIMAHWMWKKWQKENDNRTDGKVAMLTTVVSSRVLQSMAEAEGFHFEETLTGFKWLGQRADDLSKDGYTVLFAYEEAIGYMFGGTDVLDKDGLCAGAVFVEIINDCYKKGMKLSDYIQSLYEKYGTRSYKQGYFVIDSSVDSQKIFEDIRKEYPDRIAGLPITSIRDLGTGLDSAAQSQLTNLPWTKGDKMITFRLEGNGFCTIRASGTEPKLKYYIDLPSEDTFGNPIDITLVEKEISQWLMM